MPVRQRLLTPILLGAATLACGALVWLTPAGSPERVLGALLLGLVLPGAALSRLLAWEDRYRRVGRLLLVPALSLAVVIVDSIILYLVGVRLDAHAWTISVAGVTLMAAAIDPLRAIPPPRLHHSRPQTRRLLSLAGAGLAILLTGAVLLTIKGVRAQASADHFTQLWLLPGARDERTATIGVFNHEGARRSYQLELTVNDRLQSLWTVQLRPGGHWTTPVQLPPQAGLVQATLVQTSSPEVAYREVHLRLAPTAGAGAPSSTPAGPTPSVSNSVP
jgi:uncharacterized membrane protein